MILILVAPLMLVAMLTIVFAEGRPVFFRQTRVGYKLQEFDLLKFRTMVVNEKRDFSQEPGGDEITLIGSILRRLKIDELPQLINVLGGDMSLVGPRPCLPSQMELRKARRKFDLYSIQPGITGPAQIVGLDMSNPDELSKTDAQYLRDASLKYDFSILLKTATGNGSGDRVR